MIRAGTLLRAPVWDWKVTMSPAGHGNKYRNRPDQEITVQAFDKPEAIRKAGEQAEAGGFSGYAITKIEEEKS